MDGKLGMIIDGTGHNYAKIKKEKGRRYSLKKYLVLDDVPLKVLLLPHPLNWVLPEEPDDRASHQLWVAAKEGKDPSVPLVLLLLVVPGAPVEQVVDQEGYEKAGRPLWVAVPIKCTAKRSILEASPSEATTRTIAM